ncbi:MAG: hypothetical protein KGL26_03115 [Pseudomonadota bacterium]|nr:hypothetical protein [Pseudomonadota bacterium]
MTIRASLLTPQPSWARKLKNNSKRGSMGCILWTGPVNSDGYGIFTYRDYLGEAHTISAHKAAFLVAGGTLAPGEVVRHVACHRTLCINAAHLAPGSQRQNLDDRRDSGTYYNRGGRVADAERIERLAALASGMTAKEMAARYGIRINAAYQWIRRNKRKQATR